MGHRRIGAAVIGLGGAVATTAVAGLELVRLGIAGTEGLPLAGAPHTDDLVPYDGIVFGGWDVHADDLATAAEGHGVLGPAELAAAGPALAAVRPWAAVASPAWCRNVDGGNRARVAGPAEALERIRADLRAFRASEGLDEVVVLNLASTERQPDPDDPALRDPDALEATVREDSATIGPALLYALAAVQEGMPYCNFTPSVAADAPSMIALALREGVPTAGKDGKTGQTLMKTVIAPALRERALKVEGWFSSNILGNRDGLALDDPESLRSKLGTKGSVLDAILGYEVEDHVVRIDYYRPRGDQKEAWDTIDLVGFLGQRMQLKLNFLCRDSILAAPLAIELVRLLDLAGRRGEAGPQEQLSAFFKAPTTRDGAPEHALHRQAAMLGEWLAQGAPVPAEQARP